MSSEVAIKTFSNVFMNIQKIQFLPLIRSWSSELYVHYGVKVPSSTVWEETLTESLSHGTAKKCKRKKKPKFNN